MMLRMQSCVRRAYHTHRPLHRGRRAASVRNALPQPCVLLTSSAHVHSAGLRLAAEKVRAILGCRALIVAPSARDAPCEPATRICLLPDHPSARDILAAECMAGDAAHAVASEPTAAGQRRVTAVPRTDLGQDVWEVEGCVTPTDCVLVALDQQQGLFKSLGLVPVLTVAGVVRGHALSSALDTHPNVALARCSAVMGVPALAVHLASSSRLAPLDAAAEALGEVLGAIRGVLDAGGGWPTPTNYPRAHYPFPQRGRWALGREIPWPDPAMAAQRAPGAFAAADCWALGEDPAWIASPSRSGTSHTGSTSTSGSAVQSATSRPSLSPLEARTLLRAAFAEADTLLVLNVPPGWGGSSNSSGSSSGSSGGSSSGGSSRSVRGRFAAARPGVLWQIHQVEGWEWEDDVWDGTGEEDNKHQEEQQEEQQGGDPWGRSLPSQEVAGGGAMSAGRFVPQDNTAAVIARARQQQYDADTQQYNTDTQQYDADTQQYSADTRMPDCDAWTPDSTGQEGHSMAGSEAEVRVHVFTLGRGTLLNDECVAGDVEAVMGGCASLVSLPTWPQGHPFCLTDELLAAALVPAAGAGGEEGQEGPNGLPAWLV